VLNRSVALEGLVLVAVLLLTVCGIGSFGIWDPWELVVAEAARNLSASGADSSLHTPVTTWLLAAAFDAFGAHEWSGRLPGVIAAILSGVLVLVLLARPYGRRAGIIALAVMASTPMFLLNARLLMGDAIAVFAQAWVGLAAVASSSESFRRRDAPVWFFLLALGVLISTLCSGVLLGPLPPMLAVSAWILLSEETGTGTRLARWLLPTVSLVLIAGVLNAVFLDDPSFSYWLGGGAVGGNPPSFDEALELIFHGFAPWSAALPLAVIWVLMPNRNRSPEAQRTAWVLILWVAFAFASWTLFASRYGTPPYLASVPLAALIAIWINELSSEPRARWTSAAVVALLMGVLIRDYALYPESPLRVLAVEGLELPDVYNPRGAWALLFSFAALLIGLGLVSHESLARPRPAAAMQRLESLWNRGWAERLWLLIAALALGTCFTFGLLCLLLDLRIASIAVRVGRVAFFVPFVLAVLFFGLPWLRFALGRLGTFRFFPALAGGLAIGAFVALSFQPALSAHFSPKAVYDAYTELSEGKPEPLASYDLPSTSAHYYTSAAIEQIDSSNELIEFLGKPGQRWVVMEAEQLPRLDRAYRQETGEHLNVADARNARLLLISARPIEGRSNESFLAHAVLNEAPEPQHRVGANYDEVVELIGYDLELPRGDSVGAGQHFVVTWYWRVLGKVPTGYEVFVHIDAHGLRLNGDHIPVAGRYPTKLWEEGDVIADSQELMVPANFRTGDYVMYVGLFSGSKRLEVKSGPNDGVNRVEAGTLPIR
jgi:hypothetical protein